MRDRIKWILVGLGFTFGFQVLISLLSIGVASSIAAGQSDVGQTTFPVITFGLAVGAFLIGGFIVGWMSEELRLADSFLAAVATLLVMWLAYWLLPQGNKGQLLSIDILHSMGQVAAFVALALAAAMAGAYWGWHVKVPQEGVLDRIALLIGLVGAVVGPFLLLALGGQDRDGNAQSLPGYFLIIVLVLVIGIVGVGFYMFTRESHYDEEISINPDRRDAETQQ